MRRPAPPRAGKLVYTAAPLDKGGNPSISTARADRIVSKQDTHFFNTFSLVIGLLVVIALILFAVGRIVGGGLQHEYVLEDQEYIKRVQDRVQPFAREAISGKDNRDLTIQPNAAVAQAAPAPVAEPKTGQELFQQTCSTCHGQGLVGAPKVGDAAAWKPRIAKGKATLYEHALKGFTGTSGTMPPKGGSAAPDALVQQAVDYMVSQVK
jgi:cytochrome c5